MHTPQVTLKMTATEIVEMLAKSVAWNTYTMRTNSSRTSNYRGAEAETFMVEHVLMPRMFGQRRGPDCTPESRAAWELFATAKTAEWERIKREYPIGTL